MDAKEILEIIARKEAGFEINGDSKLTDEVKDSIEDTDWERVSENNSETLKDEQWNNLKCEGGNPFLNGMRENANISRKVVKGTKGYFIKRIINRILRLTNQYQELYNFNAINAIEKTDQKFAEIYVGMDDITQRIRDNDKRVRDNDKRICDNDKEILEVDKKILNSRKQILETGERINGVEKWVKLLDTRMNNDERWSDQLSDRIQKQEDAYKGLRDELFYELDRRVRSIGEETVKKNSKTVIKESYYKKLEQHNGEKKINVGCGPQELEGYINVDMRDLLNVDIVAGAMDLPFEKEELDEILTSHLIEHFTNTVMQREVMPYWYGKLKKGGKLRCILPNMDYVIKKYVTGEISFENLEELTMGGQEYEGNFHYAMYSPQKLETLLREVGFSKVELIDAARKNGLCWEMEIVATK